VRVALIGVIQRRQRAQQPTHPVVERVQEKREARVPPITRASTEESHGTSVRPSTR
jgi:hypothetical protein